MQLVKRCRSPLWSTRRSPTRGASTVIVPAPTVQGPPPEGRSRWTLRLLSDRIVELGISDEPVSNSAIGRLLKKTR